jgi:hypothetical protein
MWAEMGFRAVISERGLSDAAKGSSTGKLSFSA